MSKSFAMTTDGMQATGIHFMNANNKQNHEIDRDMVKRALEQGAMEQALYVERLMEKDKDCKPFEGRTLVPVGNRVVVKPYEKNPYRIPLQQTTSGLIVGDMETASTFKSQDTGEKEASERGIWCCEVIAVGSECKTVQIGEDVYINFMMAAPVPFGGKGYYSINESNIMCSVR